MNNDINKTKKQPDTKTHQVKCFVMFLLLPAIISAGLMYLVTAVNPLRHGINLETYFICLISTYIAFFILWRTGVNSDRDRYT